MRGGVKNTYKKRRSIKRRSTRRRNLRNKRKSIRGGGCETEKCPKSQDGNHTWGKGSGHTYNCKNCGCRVDDS